ncbi:hypothetical protein BH24PSE2_BH24PSE2_19230 [soil metagenome]
MDEYLSEKEQINALREWWRENGRWILSGIVIGVAVLVGWRMWNQHQTAQAEAASQIYGELLAAVESGRREAAETQRATLTQEYAGTPYAAQSGLAIAKLYMESGDVEAAVEALESVAAATGDEELAHIARLRLARAQLELDRLDRADEVLTGVDEGRFAPLYAELRGDILAARGDTAGARAAYQRALESADPGIVDRNLVQMKLDGIATAAMADAASAEPGEAAAAGAEPADESAPDAPAETPAAEAAEARPGSGSDTEAGGNAPAEATPDVAAETPAAEADDASAGREAPTAPETATDQSEDTPADPVDEPAP